MAKNTHSGDPLYLSWKSDLATVGKNDGETVDVTGDDQGCERTSILPDSVDTEDLADTQRRIIEAAVRNPRASQTELAEIADSSRNYVGKILRKHYPDHPSVGMSRREMGEFGDKKRSESEGDATEETPGSDSKTLLEETPRDTDDLVTDIRECCGVIKRTTTSEGAEKVVDEILRVIEEDRDDV